jgi:uncharacterized Fe-S cluster protein YjdI
MKNVVKHYTNGEITVVWDSGLCTHSTNCWRGLLSVFDPRKHPWINMDAADSNAIMQQAMKCPSGALTCYVNETSENTDQ